MPRKDLAEKYFFLNIIGRLEKEGAYEKRGNESDYYFVNEIDNEMNFILEICKEQLGSKKNQIQMTAKMRRVARANPMATDKVKRIANEVPFLPISFQRAPMAAKQGM